MKLLEVDQEHKRFIIQKNLNKKPFHKMSSISHLDWHPIDS